MTNIESCAKCGNTKLERVDLQTLDVYPEIHSIGYVCHECDYMTVVSYCYEDSGKMMEGYPKVTVAFVGKSKAILD